MYCPLFAGFERRELWGYKSAPKAPCNNVYIDHVLLLIYRNVYMREVHSRDGQHDADPNEAHNEDIEEGQERDPYVSGRIMSS